MSMPRNYRTNGEEQDRLIGRKIDRSTEKFSLIEKLEGKKW